MIRCAFSPLAFGFILVFALQPGCTRHGPPGDAPPPVDAPGSRGASAGSPPVVDVVSVHGAGGAFTTVVKFYGRSYWLKPVSSSPQPDGRAYWSMQLNGDNVHASLSGCDVACPGSAADRDGCDPAKMISLDGATIVFGSCRLEVLQEPGTFRVKGQQLNLYSAEPTRTRYSILGNKGIALPAAM